MKHLPTQSSRSFEPQMVQPFPSPHLFLACRRINVIQQKITEKSFRRIMGYKDLWALKAILDEKVEKDVAPKQKVA